MVKVFLGISGLIFLLDSFLASVNWTALLEYAAKKRKGVSCKLLPDIGLGYNHMVRIVQFSDGNQ